MSTKDLRIEAILKWLKNQLQIEIESLTPASTDASFRRYFRIIVQGKPLIIMDAPPKKEDIKPFIKVAKLFSDCHINVPEIIQINLEQGFLLLEDFGSHCYLDLLNSENADSLYLDALNSLFFLQSNTQLKNCDFPEYDQQLLLKELDIFSEWFLAEKLNLRLTQQQKAILNNTWLTLVNSALAQPRTCVHRDYHSRNLMFTETKNPGVIDFQDAVIGPVCYDLVSLLRDCYINWPERKVTQWQTEYFHRLEAAGLVTCNIDTFQYWFDLMGMQRHLKAIGIFSRLELRDSKANYLQDIPRTMNYITQVSSRYPELAEFNDFLDQTVLPAWRICQ